MPAPDPLDWRALWASVRGAAHVRVGLPNQDGLRVVQRGDGRAWLVALADGHGSARSFRSDEGAQLAVDMAYQVCGPLFRAEGHPSPIKRWAEEQLPLELVRGWQARVDRSLQRRPFTPRELAALDADGQRRLAGHPYLAYGSTLLAVVVGPDFILYLQLGDGDILTVSAGGDIERPIAKDPRLLGNETTSLCSLKAWNEVRVRFQALAGAPPVLILAATDGYANAFRDEAGFQQAARDYWDLLREGGEAAVQPHLRDWLNEASRQGSGDDISLGILWRSATGPGR